MVDEFDKEKAQKIIDSLSKDAEKSGDWGAALSKFNRTNKYVYMVFYSFFIE